MFWNVTNYYNEERIKIEGMEIEHNNDNVVTLAILSKWFSSKQELRVPSDISEPGLVENIINHGFTLKSKDTRTTSNKLYLSGTIKMYSETKDFFCIEQNIVINEKFMKTKSIDGQLAVSYTNKFINDYVSQIIQQLNQINQNKYWKVGFSNKGFIFYHENDSFKSKTQMMKFEKIEQINEVVWLPYISDEGKIFVNSYNIKEKFTDIAAKFVKPITIGTGIVFLVLGIAGVKDKGEVKKINDDNIGNKVVENKFGKNDESKAAKQEDIHKTTTAASF